MLVSLPVSWEQLTAEGLLLRLAAIAEIQQPRVQHSRIYVRGFPSGVEVGGVFFIGDEAPVEVDFEASGLSQALQGLQQVVQ